LCLGARRTAQFTDADFHNLDVEASINILLTIGELDDAMKNFDPYRPYSRGYDDETGDVEDEPERELETVLCLTLTVRGDLEPSWTLPSDHAQAQNAGRNLG
jgi:putative ATP-dependent endonuclease of the OLD family